MNYDWTLYVSGSSSSNDQKENNWCASDQNTQKAKKNTLYDTKQSFSENTFFKQHTDDAIKNDDTW